MEIKKLDLLRQKGALQKIWKLKKWTFFPAGGALQKIWKLKKIGYTAGGALQKKMDLLRQEGSPKYIGKIYEKVGNTVFNKNGNFVVGKR